MSSDALILVAEDKVELLDILERILTREGYRVLTATDGEQAFSLLQERDVQLILLDYKIPGPDGLELLRKSRKCETAPAIILMSGHPSPSLEREAKELGAVEFLSKPFALETLTATVRGALDHAA